VVFQIQLRSLGLSHKPGLFSGATSNRAVGKVILLMGVVIFPAEKSFCKWEQSFFRRKSRSAHGRSHFSDRKVAGQTFNPPPKLAKPFFRRKNDPSNWSSHFSGAQIVLQTCLITSLPEKWICKFAKRVVQRKNP
jgi:hypothetical protein